MLIISTFTRKPCPARFDITPLFQTLEAQQVTRHLHTDVLTVYQPHPLVSSALCCKVVRYVVSSALCCKVVRYVVSSALC